MAARCFEAQIPFLTVLLNKDETETLGFTQTVESLAVITCHSLRTYHMLGAEWLF